MSIPVPIPIFTGSTGLNTVDDPVRIKWDATGLSELAVAVDVVVEDSGRVSRRNGRLIKVGAANAHSLFCDGGDCLFRTGKLLVRLLPDFTFETLTDSFQENTRVDYVQVNDEIYFTCPNKNGLIKDHKYQDWKATRYVGPDTNRIFSNPPNGEHIAFYGARVFVSVGSDIFFSDPYAFSLFDYHRNHISLESKVRMMKSVETGIFISTETKTYFISGPTSKEWQLKQVADYPALEWSVAIDLVEGLDIGLSAPGLCALWVSSRGACLGTSTGEFLNLTQQKVVYPNTNPVGASVLKGHILIQTLGE